MLGLDTTTSFTLQGIPGGSTISFDNATDTVVFACFLRGTRVLTPRGEVEVENLSPGDMVVTLNRGKVAIRWIGRRILDPKSIDKPRDALRSGSCGGPSPKTYRIAILSYLRIIAC